MKDDYVEIDVTTIRETQLAVLFSDGDREFWVPKSVLGDYPEVDTVGVALVEEWFAFKEDLI